MNDDELMESIDWSSGYPEELEHDDDDEQSGFIGPDNETEMTKGEFRENVLEQGFTIEDANNALNERFAEEEQDF